MNIAICPVCKNTTIPTGSFQFLEIDKTKPLQIDYHICSCSFMYYRFDNIEKLYNENNKYIHRDTGSGADKIFDIKRLTNSFSAIKNELKDGMKLLDIGCNNGTFLKIIKENNPTIELYGSEINIEQSTIDALGKEGITVLKTLNLNDFNQQFDFITINHVLEHIDDINLFVEQLKKISTKNTKIYIEVPDAKKYIDQYFQPFSYFDLEHINHFNIENLSLFLAIHGYKKLAEFDLKIPMSNNIDYPGIGILIAADENNNTTTKINYNNEAMNKYLLAYIDKSTTELNNFQYKNSFDDKVIFGVGANTLRTIGLLNKDISKLNYFVDNNPVFHGRYINNKAIKSTADLINDATTPDVIIFSKLYFDEIKNDLLAKGYKGKIFSFFY